MLSIPKISPIFPVSHFDPSDINISSPNVVLMKPRIDVRPYIAEADYVLQLSNDMETYCYTINEALGYGVPIVTTPLSVVKELPIDDNMRIELEYDCSNADEVARQIFVKEVKPFEYEPPKDGWADILAKGESTYKEELQIKVRVRAIKTFHDMEEDIRADFLLAHKAIEVLEEIKETPIKLEPDDIKVIAKAETKSKKK